MKVVATLYQDSVESSSKAIFSFDFYCMVDCTIEPTDARVIVADLETFDTSFTIGAVPDWS